MAAGETLIQSLAITALSEFPIVFRGGMYLWFFHGLRRFSEDLDFTEVEELQEEMPEKVSRNLSLFGVENELKIMKNNDVTLSFRISASGPLNTGLRDRCIVYIEVSKREEIIEDRIPLRFDHPEYALPIKSISGMALEEVGAEKVRAMMTRQKARDLYDLYYLVQSKKIKFNKELINEKLKYYEIRFSKNAFVDNIGKVESFYERELKGIVFDTLPDFEVVATTMKGWTH